MKHQSKQSNNARKSARSMRRRNAKVFASSISSRSHLADAQVVARAASAAKDAVIEQLQIDAATAQATITRLHKQEEEELVKRSALEDRYHRVVHFYEDVVATKKDEMNSWMKAYDHERDSYLTLSKDYDIIEARMYQAQDEKLTLQQDIVRLVAVAAQLETNFNKVVVAAASLRQQVDIG
jgi:hypothetical protein